MTEDPIIQELRRIREQTVAACGHDWKKLIAHYRQIEKATKQKVIRGKPRRLPRPRKSA